MSLLSLIQLITAETGSLFTSYENNIYDPNISSLVTMEDDMEVNRGNYELNPMADEINREGVGSDERARTVRKPKEPVHTNSGLFGKITSFLFGSSSQDGKLQSQLSSKENLGQKVNVTNIPIHVPDKQPICDSSKISTHGRMSNIGQGCRVDANPALIQQCDKTTLAQAPSPLGHKTTSSSGSTQVTHTTTSSPDPSQPNHGADQTPPGSSQPNHGADQTPQDPSQPNHGADQTPPDSSQPNHGADQKPPGPGRFRRVADKILKKAKDVITGDGSSPSPGHVDSALSSSLVGTVDDQKNTGMSQIMLQIESDDASGTNPLAKSSMEGNCINPKSGNKLVVSTRRVDAKNPGDIGEEISSEI